MISQDVENLIDRALAEDLASGDPTTEGLVSRDQVGYAEIVSREDGVLAGVEVASAVFRRVDPDLDTHALLEDGARLEPGSVVAWIGGSVASILTAERTALNFLYRLCGVATLTDAYVEAVKDYESRIVDTRKTTPGLRSLEKAAVRAGGGFNHRRNLGDGILIKDNHIEALRAQGLGLKETVELSRSRASHTLRVEVEVEDLIQVRQALDGGAEILLLDNMDAETMTEAVKMAKGHAATEASGGITLDTVREVAATGVDLISVGALTHSVIGLNLSLEMRIGTTPSESADQAR